MNMTVPTEQEEKRAFRNAYNFYKEHIAVLRTPEEYQRLASDLAKALGENAESPLACRLISGVFDFICATSKVEENK